MKKNKKEKKKLDINGFALGNRNECVSDNENGFINGNENTKKKTSKIDQKDIKDDCNGESSLIKTTNNEFNKKAEKYIKDDCNGESSSIKTTNNEFNEKTEKYIKDDSPIESFSIKTTNNEFNEKTEKYIKDESDMIRNINYIRSENINEITNRDKLDYRIRRDCTRMIDMVNKFNMTDYDRPYGIVENIEINGWKGKAYHMNVLGNPLKNKKICNKIIYNPKLRGKSGCEIFFSGDFLIAFKTIRKSEFQCINKIVDKYVMHRGQNSKTLLVEYYGVYWMETREGGIYYVAMRNIFEQMHDKIYDLKGINVKRANDSGILTENDIVSLKSELFKLSKLLSNKIDKECSINESIKNKYKINDFEKENIYNNNNTKCINQNTENINIQKYFSNIIDIEAAKSDCDFLCSLGLVDYSLVIGVGINKGYKDFGCSEKTHLQSLENQNTCISLGIVDILTKYNRSKCFEQGWHWLCCMENRSLLSPQGYSARFKELLDFIFN